MDHSRDVAELAKPDPLNAEANAAEADVTPAERPNGIDKPDGELESLNQDGQKVEKRTTM